MGLFRPATDYIRRFPSGQTKDRGEQAGRSHLRWRAQPPSPHSHPPWHCIPLSSTLHPPTINPRPPSVTPA